MYQEKHTLQQSSIEAPRHYHEPIAPHSQDANARLLWLFGFMWLSLVIVGIIYARSTVVQASTYLIYILLGLSLIGVPATAVYLVWHKWYMDDLRRKHAELDRKAKHQQIRQDEERHALAIKETQLVPDQAGNYPAVVNRLTSQVIYIQPGQYIPNVPAHYSPSESNRYDYKGLETKVTEGAPNIAAPLLLPEKVLMQEVMRKWDLTPDNLFLALGKGHQELSCTLEDLMHIAHDAPTGYGKTAQFYAELIMLLKLNIHTILANPHFAPVDKKGNDWRPIGQAIDAQGMIEVAPGVRIPGLIRNYQSIANMLDWLANAEIDRRFTMQAKGDYSYEPLYIFVDELPSVVKRFPAASDDMVDVLQRGRAVEVLVSSAAQGFLSEDVSLKGSARENYNTAFHMGGSVHSGSKLLDMPIREINAQLKEATLGKGIALLRNNVAVPQAQLVRLPFANNDYAYYMLGKAEGWVLPELRTAQGVYQRETEAETLETAVEADASPLNSAFTVYGGNTNSPSNDTPVSVSLETRATVKRMSKAGDSHRNIAKTVGLSGRYYSSVYKPLCREMGIKIEGED